MRSVSVAAVFFLAVSACGPGTTGDDNPNMVTALTVAPATATLESVDMAQVQQAFTVKATYADGSIADVTDQVGWNVEAQYGTFAGATFTTMGYVGGVATVSALLDGAVGTALVTINIRGTVIDPSAPPDAPGLFDNGTVDASRAPTIVYPPDQVIVPANLGDFDVHWADTVGNDVFEVSLKGDHTDLRIYVGASAPRWLAFTAAQWQMASANQHAVTAKVRGVLTTMPGVIGETAGRVATLTDQATEGGLYYWASSSSVPGAPYGIFRHDLSQPGVPAEQFYTTVEAGQCVACHVLSRDGTKMAVTYAGGNGPAALLDVATRTATPSPSGAWNFGTYNPAGDTLVTSQGGTLTVRDAGGNPTGTVATSAFATHPDFSPIGSSIAYVLAPSVALGSADWNIPDGQIIVQSYDAVNHTFGTATPLVTTAGNNYYPSISPDGEWVLYNHADADGSYNNGNAELWVTRTNGTGTPIKLDLANIGAGLTNSWARWAPFEQSVNGEKMFWLTVSSKRDFGIRLVGQARPQIWMAGFFPGRAAAGTDPSAPAFWLPFQDITTNNHIAQWTEMVIPIE